MEVPGLLGIPGLILGCALVSVGPRCHGTHKSGVPFEGELFSRTFLFLSHVFGEGTGEPNILVNKPVLHFPYPIAPREWAVAPAVCVCFLPQAEREPLSVCGFLGGDGAMPSLED